jgi:CelD/BcsL family acetyltransferase involved in cellulose biosynthesis
LILGVRDETGRLIGIAPWYLQRSAAKGRVLRWLGTGQVCSEYLSVLCQAHDTDRVTEALAEYLSGPECSSRGGNTWDLLEVDGVAADDRAATQLLAKLAQRKCTQVRNAPIRCWRLTLPESWDEFQMMVSRGHRRKLRRADRDLFDTGRAVLHVVKEANQLDTAWDTLIKLHQKRRNMFGDSGCFTWSRYTAFHREVTPELLARGQLQFSWLELDGQTIAAMYQLISHGITYIYQMGIDTDKLDDEPGHLVIAATIKRAIEQGGQAVDFLRGDEPYKPHFRAEPREMLALRIVPNRALPLVRNRIYLQSRELKRWWTKTGPGYKGPLVTPDSQVAADV